MRAAELARGLIPGTFCWTCGSVRDPRDFSPKPDEADGLSAECYKCEEFREVARRMDGEAGPRKERIEGEGRKRDLNPLVLQHYIDLDQAMRSRRGWSGLQAADGAAA